MEQNEIKGLAVVLFFVDTMFFGCLPYFLVGSPSKVTSLRTERIRDQVISYLNCFAGGVFLGACLLHLLVEGRETLGEYFHESGVEMDYPVYETVVAGGFFLIALIEQLAHRALTQTTPSLAPPPAHTADLEVISDVSSDVSDSASVPGTVQVSPRRTVSTVSTVSSGINGGMNGVSNISKRGAASKNTPTKSNKAKVSPSKVAPRKVTGARRPSSLLLGAEMERRVTADMRESGGVYQVMLVRPMRAYLLLGAFSFHTTFDGLAVGLQTDTAQIWQMFAAIIIHKSLVAISLGLQLFLVYRAQPKKAALCILIFSLISPIGLGIGMSVVSSDIDELAKTLSRGVLEGISTGTFLYVAFFEILHGELGEKKGLLRLLLVVIGFASTAAPKVFHTDHGHEEEE